MDTVSDMDAVSDISKVIEHTEICFIERAVEYLRKLYVINPTPGYKFELSDIAFGEGHNLLYRQLLLTTNGYDAWQGLKDHDIRALVIDEIHKDRKMFTDRASPFYRSFSNE